ncbi:MAG: hypothetical protein GWP14_05710 [Actinobacteria bacterium]|nr:hypothetical protein [Actinomycetota bacterium]
MSSFEIFIYGAIFVLALCTYLCMYRICRGPTAADRTVGIDILGVTLVSFCALLGVLTGRDLYITLAIAWALLAFIATIGLGKYLEGRSFDE